MITLAELGEISKGRMTPEEIAEARARSEATKARKAAAGQARTDWMSEGKAKHSIDVEGLQNEIKRQPAARKQAAHEAVEGFKGRYKPDYLARLAAKKIPTKAKVGALAAGTGAAALASPFSRKKHQQDKEPERAKRTAAGAAIGAGAGYGAYAGGSYALSNTLGHVELDPKKSDFAGEMTNLRTKHGVVPYKRAEGVQPKSSADNHARAKHYAPQKGKIYEAYKHTPDHIPNAGGIKLANRLYGPGTFGRKSKLVLGGGAAIGAAAAHGIPSFKRKQEQKRQPYRRLQAA